MASLIPYKSGSYDIAEILLEINVKEARRGNQERTIQRNGQYHVNTRHRRKTNKTKNKKILHYNRLPILINCCSLC
jgi:hypothetical protein